MIKNTFIGKNNGHLHCGVSGGKKWQQHLIKILISKVAGFSNLPNCWIPDYQIFTVVIFTTTYRRVFYYSMSFFIEKD